MFKQAMKDIDRSDYDKVLLRRQELASQSFERPLSEDEHKEMKTLEDTLDRVEMERMKQSFDRMDQELELLKKTRRRVENMLVISKIYGRRQRQYRKLARVK